MGFVYKYVLDKEVIYIGKTDKDNVADRLNCHGKSGDNIPEEAWDEINKADIYYAECANSSMTDTIESALINKYHPKYNRAKMQLWEGLQFIEPVWYFYEKKENKSELRRQVDRLNAALITAKAKKERAEWEEVEAKRELMKLQEEFETYKSIYFIKSCHECRSEIQRLRWDEMNRLKKASEDSFYSTKGKTFEEVLEEYREGESVAYVSKSFDAFGNVECVKRIYSVGYSLEFDFHCPGIQSQSGRIYMHPTNQTMSNWNILKTWKCRGSMFYYPFSEVEA